MLTAAGLDLHGLAQRHFPQTLINTVDEPLGRDSSLIAGTRNPAGNLSCRNTRQLSALTRLKLKSA